MKKILILLIIVLAFFPLIRANTTFYEGAFFLEGPPIPTDGGGATGGGSAPTISCWKIVDNTCVLEELEDYYCPSGYFSTESICKSALEIIPEKSIIDKVLDIVKEFFGIETEDEVISTFSIVDSEEVIEDTEEEITETNKTNRNVIAVVVLIIIGYLILNKK